jgi:hypothetical protein
MSIYRYTIIWVNSNLNLNVVTCILSSNILTYSVKKLTRSASGISPSKLKAKTHGCLQKNHNGYIWLLNKYIGNKKTCIYIYSLYLYKLN